MLVVVTKTLKKKREITRTSLFLTLRELKVWVRYLPRLPLRCSFGEHVCKFVNDSTIQLKKKESKNGYVFQKKGEIEVLICKETSLKSANSVLRGLTLS